MKGAILVVDDEESLRRTFKAFLVRDGYDVRTAADYDSACEAITMHRFDVVFADIVLGGKTGIDILRFVTQGNVFCPVIMITGQPNLNTAAEAVRLGAFDYLLKPVEKGMLLLCARQALRHRRMAAEKRKAERNNERYRKHLEAIFRSVHECILTVDPQMNVIAANQMTRHALGVEPSWLIGRPSGEASPCR